MNQLWKLLYDFLLGQLTRPKPQDNDAMSGGFNMTLGSGYDAQADRAEKVRNLRELCYHIITDPDYQPRDGKTYCNMAVRYVSQRCGCNDFPLECMANEMVDIMGGSPCWRKDTAERAADHAKRGALAVVGKKYKGHGHVAIIAPDECKYSGSWGSMVPVVANVGKRNGYMKTSEAFPVAEGEPSYFIWMGETW